MKYTLNLIAMFLISGPAYARTELFTVDPPKINETDKAVEIETRLNYESRYILEGRDTLDGDGLAEFSMDAAYKNFNAGVYYANSPQSSYDEVKFSLAYNIALGGGELAVGYTHLRQPDSNTHDNEFGLIFTRPLPCEFQLSIDSYYSFGSRGYFVEGGISRPIQISSKLMFEPALLLGMNQGFVAEGHNGLNHAAVFCKICYEFTTSLELEIHGAYTQGINRDVNSADDSSLKNQLHGGIALVYNF